MSGRQCRILLGKNVCGPSQEQEFLPPHRWGGVRWRIAVHLLHRVGRHVCRVNLHLWKQAMTGNMRIS